MTPLTEQLNVSDVVRSIDRTIYRIEQTRTTLKQGQVWERERPPHAPRASDLTLADWYFDEDFDNDFDTGRGCVKAGGLRGSGCG